MAPDIPIEALESLRQSQAHLSHSLSTFLVTLQQDPLPPAENLLTTLSLLLSHLNSLTTTLQNPRFSEDLKSTAVYPNNSFPVRSQETILTSLLRRKLNPEDEEWEEEGRRIAEGLEVDIEREDEFIEWCQNRFLNIVEEREYVKGIKTKEEKERDGDEEDERSEDMDEDEGVGETENMQGIGLGAALKYLAQGLEPTKPPQYSTPGHRMNSG